MNKFLSSMLASHEKHSVEYIALPSRSRPKWLFPISHSNASITQSFYKPSGILGKVSTVNSKIDKLFGNYFLIDKDKLEELRSILGAPKQTNLVVYLGSSGAYSKTTLAVIDDIGRPIAYAKISESIYAKDALENEERILKSLGTIENVRDYVPQIISSALWNEKKVLVLSPVEGLMGSLQYNGFYHKWLALLFLQTCKQVPFSETSYWNNIMRGTSDLQESLPGSWQVRYEKAFSILKTKLLDTDLPVAVAQRDFAPWNTCLKEDSLSVFDWEMGQAGYPPLYDFFHFHAIQAALKNKRLSNCLADAKTLLDMVWPNGKSYISELYLAYLVDQSLFYLKARQLAPDVGDDRVSIWMGKEIERILQECEA